MRLSNSLFSVASLHLYLTAAQTRLPLMRAAVGIPISVKVFQNFELFSYFADKDDCVL